MENFFNTTAELSVIFGRIGVMFQSGFCHIADHFIPHHRNHYRPHMLGHRALALYSVMLISLKIFVLSALALGPVEPAFSSAITASNIISLTNASRQEYALAGLKENNILDIAAQAKADDMLARSYFSHNTPDGRTPWSFITAAGYDYLMAGENLAVNFTEAENVEDAWMNSPGHKANILNKNFEEIGIGISQGDYQGHAAIFVVQMFGVPSEHNLHLNGASTKVQSGDVPLPSVQDGRLPIATSGAAVKIADVKVSSDGQNANISVETNSSAFRVVAIYGQRAVMLEPKDAIHWQGSVSLEKLAAENRSLVIDAFDIRGGRDIKTAGEFAASAVKNYNVLGASSPVRASVFGFLIDLKATEQRAYLLFAAVLLSSLILAIGIKRHVQHLSLIANTSFVAILAVMLFAAG